MVWFPLHSSHKNPFTWYTGLDLLRKTTKLIEKQHRTSSWLWGKQVSSTGHKQHWSLKKLNYIKIKSCYSSKYTVREQKGNSESRRLFAMYISNQGLLWRLYNAHDQYKKIWRTGTLRYSWWKYKLVYSLSLNIRLPYDTAIAVATEMCINTQKKSYIRISKATIFPTAKEWTYKIKLDCASHTTQPREWTYYKPVRWHGWMSQPERWTENSTTRVHSLRFGLYKT